MHLESARTATNRGGRRARGAIMRAIDVDVPTLPVNDQSPDDPREGCP